jgi:hypothetical protein
MTGKEKLKCQMTMESGDPWPIYAKCGKPAKYRNPNPQMGVEYMCGIHAKSLNMTYRRIGSDLRCIPLGDLTP